MNGFVAPALGGNINAQSSRPTALAQGFAVVSTDTGHVAAHGADASFARDQQAKLNYAYAAIGKVALQAKALTATLGGHAPERSYFMGCSNGGREGMLMAQRYPVYAEADLTVDTRDAPPDLTVDAVIEALQGAEPATGQATASP